MRRCEIKTGVVVPLVGDIAIATEIAVGDFEWMEIFPSATGTLLFYSAMELRGTYSQCYTVANSAVTQNVTANKSHACALELVSRRFLKILSDAAGTATLVLKG